MIIKRDQDTIKAYFEDSSNLRGGHAEAVVIPENIEELSGFLKGANAAKMPVTVSGGGTGTTGSRIPFGGSVLSMERFNKILGVYKDEMKAVLQPGVTVDELKKAAGAEGLFYTCHPTESAATVGGTVATNASGSRSFRYGPTRDYVRRLKMVMADGRILDLKRGLIRLSRKNPYVVLPDGSQIVVPLPAYMMPGVKNASGYFAKEGMDLVDLFIGQEGTLSVIVEIELSLVKRPASLLSSFVFFGREEDAWGFAADARDLSKRNRAARAHCAIDALSLEYFDSNALEVLRKMKADIPLGSSSAIFFEQETAAGSDEDGILQEWLRLISKHGASLDDTWVAMNETEARKFTQLRHAIPEAVNDIIRKRGFRKVSTDIAVPDAGLPEMMRFYKESLKREEMEHMIFGHIGENHVHVNMLPGSESGMKVSEELAMSFVKKGVSLGGAASAEHGIGKLKHRYLEAMYGTSGVMEMSKIKKALDPNLILGLDNIFPRELLTQILHAHSAGKICPEGPPRKTPEGF